jgi:hypothetical protein
LLSFFEAVLLPYSTMLSKVRSWTWEFSISKVSSWTPTYVIGRLPY